MSHSSTVIKAKVVRSDVIKAHKLEIDHAITDHKSHRYILRTLEKKLVVKIHELRHRLHDLKHEWRVEHHHLEKRIDAVEVRLAGIETKVASLETAIATLQTELESGLVPNAALRSLFQNKLGTSVTVTTAGGSLAGTVTQVGTNAVVLTESSGDILVIPFSKITSVQ